VTINEQPMAADEKAKLRQQFATKARQRVNENLFPRIVGEGVCGSERAGSCCPGEGRKLGAGGGSDRGGLAMPNG